MARSGVRIEARLAFDDDLNQVGVGKVWLVTQRLVKLDGAGPGCGKRGSTRPLPAILLRDPLAPVGVNISPAWYADFLKRWRRGRERSINELLAQKKAVKRAHYERGIKA